MKIPRNKNIFLFGIGLLAAMCALPYTASAHALPDAESAEAPAASPAEVPAATDDEEQLPDSVLYDTTLDDLVVTARAALVQSDGAKLTYNVTEDPEAKSSSTLDILRKVPGVTVDAQENVKVNGQSSFKIFLNGKEDPMLSGDIKTILKSMPAATIQKIEVISEPGAKYEAEGTGGILNIVTQSRQALEGYLANIGAFANNNGLGAYLYGRAKAGKVTASADLSYNNSCFHSGNRYEQESTTTNFSDPTQYFRESHTTSTNSGYYLGGGFNLSWEPDTLNLFTLGFNGRRNIYNSDARELIDMTDIDGRPVWHVGRDFEAGYSGSSIGTILSYQHTFGRRDHTIVFSYSLNHSSDGNDSYIHTFDVVNYPDIDYVWSSDERTSSQDSHILQLDYTNPFNEHHLLEAGGKANFRRADSNSAPWYGPSREDMAIDEADHVDMRQFDDIAALYASYTGTYGKWNVRTGLRYEYTRRGINYRIAPEGYSDFTNRFNDWVPDASASFSWGGTQNLRAGYQMRISRPGIWVLNPYRNTMNPGSISYGNPDLKSEKSHNLSLAYSNYNHALTGSFKTTYYFSTNAVTDVIFSTPELPGIVQTTYANVGRYNNVRFDLNLNWRATNDLNFGLYLSEDYTNIKAESEFLKAHKVNWRTTLSANADYTLPCKLRISLYGGYGSPWVDLQSEGDPWYYYSLGVGRSFLKDDRLSVNFSLNNLFPTHRRSGWSQVSETAAVDSYTRYRQWSFGLNISWRLGGLSADVKRTASRLTEENVSGGNSNKN